MTRGSARELASAVRSRRMSATEAVEDSLAAIAARNGAINAFTAVVKERALAAAAAIDAAVGRGRDPGPLAGVPFAVKNLYDVAGIATVAGSRIDRDRAPAAQDAALARRLTAAGAILVGACNMDEYAFGFSTENTHHGPTRNPHDPARVAGGSSGGSAAAVAAGLVPLTLGSDTNGSIRVPAALCGVFGLRPTIGRLSRAGMRLFAASLDVGGPFARTTEDLALAYDALQGPDPADPACVSRPPEPTLALLTRGVEGLRIAVAQGYYASQGAPEAFAAVERVASALGVTRRIELPSPGLARGAAMIMTSVEGAELHLEVLIARAEDFDPKTRARFLAGALAPGAWYAHAQRVRRQYCVEIARTFASVGVDVVLAPATPYPAFPIGETWTEHGGQRVPLAGHLGVFTQPLSFAGLPIVAAPVADCGPLPLGVQIIAAPWREDLALRTAAAAEALGAVRIPFSRRNRGSCSMIEINIPEVVAEVEKAFGRYERALVSNDIAELDALFWESPHTLRYGVTENLYGYDEIAAFRGRRPAINLARDLLKTVITTYGRDFATANAEFKRIGSTKTGRQSQVWLKTEAGWRCVAAHVSLLQEP